MQPVPEVVKPHAGQLSVVLLQHIANGVEPLVELMQQRLLVGVVGPLRHHVHVVEGEELKLGPDEVVLAGVSGHDVCQLQAVPHLGGPVQTDSQQAQEEHDHNHLRTQHGTHSINGKTAPGCTTARAITAWSHVVEITDLKCNRIPTRDLSPVGAFFFSC